MIREISGAVNPEKPACELALEDFFGFVRFAFLQRLTHADDGDESGGERGLQFPVHLVIGFAVVAAPFGVADDHVGASRVPNHRGRNVTGVRAFFVPVAVLRRDCDVAAARRVRHTRSAVKGGAITTSQWSTLALANGDP